jgi:hypothetical protein
VGSHRYLTANSSLLHGQHIVEEIRGFHTTVSRPASFHTRNSLRYGLPLNIPSVPKIPPNCTVGNKQEEKFVTVLHYALIREQVCGGRYNSIHSQI